MKNFTLTVSPMGEGISKPSYIYPMTFQVSESADIQNQGYSKFREACDLYLGSNYEDSIEEYEDFTMEAGGIGYDYRIMLERK